MNYNNRGNGWEHEPNYNYFIDDWRMMGRRERIELVLTGAVGSVIFMLLVFGMCLVAM